MSCSEEKSLLIPISVNFLAEGVSRRSSPPEWEHLKNIHTLRKLSELLLFTSKLKVTEQHEGKSLKFDKLVQIWAAAL